MVTAMLILTFPSASQTAPPTGSGVTVLSSRWYPSEITRWGKPVVTGVPEPPPGATTVKLPDVYRQDLYFFYETIVRNDTGKAIISIAWDHVFYDTQNDKVISRIPLTNGGERLDKGKTLLLKKARRSPPTLTVKANETAQENQKNIWQKIEIKCVVFSDRTNWLAEGIKPEQCANPKKGGYLN